MTFGKAIEGLRSFVGREVAVNLTDERYGAADGYVADFAGTLSRVDEPIPGVDAPVFYFRVGDGEFGVHESMFVDAEWQADATGRGLRVRLDGLVITVTNVSGNYA